MRLTGEDLAIASQGKWLKDMPEFIHGIGTDSRNFIDGHAFLALRGPSFDGHAYADRVAHKASALIGDDLGMEKWQALAIPQLQVGDTLQSLGDIANFYRSRLQHTQVIAITGSYGKTTVRSMLHHVLQTLGLEVAATQANFNNLIGVPKTLLNIPMTADVALIECGISELGEMERLSEIVQPDIAIVTGLSQAHGEGLGGLAGVAREKAKLMMHLLPQGWCVLGQAVLQQFTQAGCSITQTTYSLDDEQQAVSWVLEGCHLSLKNGEETSALTLTLPAKHWAEDMALAATVALKLSDALQKDWSLQDVVQALKTWQPVEGRMAIHPETTQQPFTLIDDAYNANPASMQAALDTLAALDGYRIAIIGDMLELGAEAETSHNQLDLYDIDEVIVVGPLMSALQAKQPKRYIRSFIDVTAFESWLEQQQTFPQPHSAVLVKSSHGLGLYQSITKLKNRGQHVI